MEPAVQVRGLGKSFRLSAKQQRQSHAASRQKVAVDNLSFEVHQGEVFGLLGPNGAGKTTTLRMLAALVRPDAGDAVIQGCSVLDDPSGVRRSIGFLTTDLRLDDALTPDYLFDFFCDLRDVPADLRDQRKQLLFGTFGVADFSQTKIADLSTGMRQKVSLAIAVAHDPGVVIFDEPTNGLDLLTARVVTTFVAQLRQQGKAVLLSTHDFGVVEKTCDRVGALVDGRLVACGPLAQVKGQHSLEDAFFGWYRAAKEGC